MKVGAVSFPKVDGGKTKNAGHMYHATVLPRTVLKMEVHCRSVGSSVRQSINPCYEHTSTNRISSLGSTTFSSNDVRVEFQNSFQYPSEGDVVFSWNESYK